MHFFVHKNRLISKVQGLDQYANQTGKLTNEKMKIKLG
jgi:hypothetical protein